MQIDVGGTVSGSSVRNLASSATLAGGGVLGLDALAGTVTNLMSARLPVGRIFLVGAAPIIVTITSARKFD
ncbi:MAG TPA: hypothetical protein PK808_08345 [Polymorphobacter sp.]|nr:hypothetical protein [Polymorphobacter sp.]